MGRRDPGGGGGRRLPVYPGGGGQHRLSQFRYKQERYKDFTVYVGFGVRV